MNCRRVMSLMSAYVDGELTGVEMLEIRRHLSECPDCSAEHDETLAMKRSVARLATVGPRPDFAAAILLRLDEVQIPVHQRMLNSLIRFAHRKLSPVAAALTASGVALVIMSAGGLDRPQPLARFDETQPAPAFASVRIGGGNASFLPELPDGPVGISCQKPLEVAHDDFGATTVSYASLGGQ